MQNQQTNNSTNPNQPQAGLPVQAQQQQQLLQSQGFPPQVNGMQPGMGQQMMQNFQQQPGPQQQQQNVPQFYPQQNTGRGIPGHGPPANTNGQGGQPYPQQQQQQQMPQQQFYGQEAPNQGGVVPQNQPSSASKNNMINGAMPLQPNTLNSQASHHLIQSAGGVNPGNASLNQNLNGANPMSSQQQQQQQIQPASSQPKPYPENQNPLLIQGQHNNDHAPQQQQQQQQQNPDQIQNEPKFQNNNLVLSATQPQSYQGQSWPGAQQQQQQPAPPNQINPQANANEPIKQGQQVQNQQQSYQSMPWGNTGGQQQQPGFNPQQANPQAQILNGQQQHVVGMNQQNAPANSNNQRNSLNSGSGHAAGQQNQQQQQQNDQYNSSGAYGNNNTNNNAAQQQQQFSASGLNQQLWQPTQQPPETKQIVGLLNELQQKLTALSQIKQANTTTTNNVTQNNTGHTAHQQMHPQQPAAPGRGNGRQYKQHFMKYFVGGILYSAKEHDLERYMKQFGKVVDVAIMRDKQSGRSRGFAFVTFEVNANDQAVCNRLHRTMLDDRHEVNGRHVEVRQSDGAKPADSFLGKDLPDSSPGAPPIPNQSVGLPQEKANNRGDRDKGADRARDQGRQGGRQDRRRRSRSRSRDRRGQ